MWSRVLQLQDQREIAADWETVLDVLVEVRGDNGRSLADANYASKLQSLCTKVLKRGFSPTALTLQLLIDLRTSGISSVNRRVIAISEFLDSHPEIQTHQDWMSGDGMSQLAELFASEPFLLPLPRSCRSLRNAKGKVIGEGFVPEDSFDEYRRSGKAYVFTVKETDLDELRAAHLEASQAGTAVSRLQQAHQFHVTAYRAILSEIQRALAECLPDTNPDIESPSEPEVAPTPLLSSTTSPTVEDPIANLLARCADAWERPYLHAAQQAYVHETRSLREALASVELLPPSLETIGSLLTEGLFELLPPVGSSPLPRGLDSLEAVHAELEKRGSHRIARSFLRRAKELTGQDDATRIRALTEDRDRWHSVVEGRLTSTSALRKRVVGLFETWRQSDPASPCVPVLAMACVQLARSSPVLEGERLPNVNDGEASPSRPPPNIETSIGGESTSALCRALEKIVLIAPRVTSNPLAIEALRRALEIASASMQNPKGTT